MTARQRDHRVMTDTSSLRVWLCLGVLAVAIALAWGGSLAAPFELDDHASIIDNPTLRDLWSFGWVHPPATAGETVSGRPVLNFSFAVNYALSELDVRSYRTLNVLLHICASGVLFGIVRRTLLLIPEEHGTASDAVGLGFAMSVALLWALHPLQTAAVTYVVQRAESMCGLFYLLTLYAFIRGAAHSVRPMAEPQMAPAGLIGTAQAAEKRRSFVWLTVATLACLAAMGTKEVAVTSPIIVLLYDRTFLSGSFREAWRIRLGVHASLLATVVVLTLLVIANRGRGGSAGFGSAVTAWSYLLTQCEAIVHYLRLAFWPRYQVFDYGTTVVSHWHDVAMQSGFLCVAFVAVALGLWRKSCWAFVGACFFVLLAPSSSVVPVATQTVAEHRMYLPLIPLVALVCMLVKRLLFRWKARYLAGALVSCAALAFGTATFLRNQVYGSELTLWRDTVQKRPDNLRARNNLGIALLDAGRDDEAIAEFNRVLEAQPDHAFAHFNIANAFIRRKQWEQAAYHLKAGLSAEPTSISARINLGKALTELGGKDDALNMYESVLADDPTAYEARTNYAALLVTKGNAAEAERQLRQVLAAKPNLPEAHYHLGLALEKEGASDAAENEFIAATTLNPQFGEAFLARGNSRARRGDAQGAVRAFEEAMRLGPNLAEARFALGNVFARQKNFDRAMLLYAEALKLDPTHVQAQNNLANCQLATGKFLEAIANYEAVLQKKPADDAVRKNLNLAREFLARRSAPRS